MKNKNAKKISMFILGIISFILFGSSVSATDVCPGDTITLKNTQCYYYGLILDVKNDFNTGTCTITVPSYVNGGVTSSYLYRDFPNGTAQMEGKITTKSREACTASGGQTNPPQNQDNQSGNSEHNDRGEGCYAKRTGNKYVYKYFLVTPLENAWEFTGLSKDKCKAAENTQSTPSKPIDKPGCNDSDSMSRPAYCNDSETIVNEISYLVPASNYTNNGVCSDVNIVKEGEIGTNVVVDHPYIDYKATANCVDDSTTSYTAMCLDPALRGPGSGSAGISYHVERTVDINSFFGKAVYYTYEEFKSGVIDANIATQVVRYLMAIYTPNNFITTGIYSGDALRYKQPVHSTIQPHLDRIVAKAQSSDPINASNATLKISRNGENGIKVTAENFESAPINPNIEFTIKQGSASVGSCTLQPTGGNTYECSTSVSYDPSAGLVEILAKVSYQNAADIKNIQFAVATTAQNVQRFLMFHDDAPLVIEDSIILGQNANACMPVADLSCTSDPTDTKIVEGTTESNSTVNWESCIIGDNAKNVGQVNSATDPAGNTYTALPDNGYCSIVCKEDYAFKLPGNLGEVKQGRYLSINVDNVYHAVTGVASQRRCVATSNDNNRNIKLDQYVNDVEKLKKEILKQLNIFAENKAIVDAMEAYGEDNYKKNKKVTSISVDKNDDFDTCNAANPSEPSDSDYKQYYFSELKINYSYKIYSFADSNNIISSQFNSKDNNSTVTIAENKDFNEVALSGESPWTESGVSDTGTCDRYYEITGLKKDTDDLKKWNEAKTKAEKARDTALSAYNSAVADIQQKTKMIKQCSEWKDDYNFGADITFDYEEKDYITMMNGGNHLVPIETPSVSIEQNYCNGKDSSVVGAFGCGGSIDDLNVQIPNNINVKSNSVGYERQDVHKAYKYAITSKYGDPGVTANGDNSGTRYVYYKSQVPFYTHPNKGIVTTSNQGGEILLDVADSNRPSGVEPDGLVFPVKLTTEVGEYQYKLKYENIGQYFGATSSSGRIMGSNGYINELVHDEYVCVYKVCSIDDPTCESPEKNTCVDILNSADCNNGNPSKWLISGTESDLRRYNACANKLLDQPGCCDYVPQVSMEITEKYNKVCPAPGDCKGFDVLGVSVNANYYNENSIINDEGKLQFYAKSSSLYNLFPNGTESKGFNWVGSTSGYESNNNEPLPRNVQDVIKEIEDKGESIYGNDDLYLNYSIVLTPTCAARIREYNNSQEKNSLGFSDYTLNYHENARHDESVFLDELEAAGCIVKKDYE